MILGLTGGIASGKSTVADIFRGLGLEVVDADRIAREVSEEKEVAEALVEAFGEGILRGGSIDRRELRRVVFSSEENVKRINGIIHPRVIEVFERRRSAAYPGEVIIFDIPLLYESRLEYLCDEVVVVSVPRETQIERIMARDGSDRETAENIISHQMTAEDKEERADHIIRNDRDLKMLKEEVVKLYEGIKNRMAGQADRVDMQG